MTKIRLLMLLACASGTLSPVFAVGETAKLVKTRLAKTADVKTGVWHAGLSKCRSYAANNGVPLIAVWSNGDACTHCTTFESACLNSHFKEWMKSSGCVFVFVYPKDSDGKQGGSVYNWCYKSQTVFPFVRVYWYKNGKKQVDTYTMGDTVDGGFSGEKGAKKAVSWFKNKLAKFKPSTAAAVVKPYTIEFAPNGATNGMAAVTATVGTARMLPANTLVYPDYSFDGWATTATGAVAYKDKASVKNLTTVSNGVVTLYAKWTRTTYRTYDAGVKATIAISDCKGWTRKSGTVAGMTWSSTNGKWTGTPTTAGTFSIKYAKGSSSKTRKIVIGPGVPYKVEFVPNANDATSEMESIGLNYGAVLALPANRFVRPDYAFSGWAKTATGAVAYKDAASVKNLTAVSNDVVTLYAKWTRTIYRTYYTGVKTTISISDCKGWTKKSGAISGMTWNPSKGKWTGTPKSAGTYTIKYKKGSSTKTRKIVVVKDAVTFADETVVKRVFAGGEEISLDLHPETLAGKPSSVKVAGLPDGIAYSDGVVTGRLDRVGTFKATVTVVSVNGQKLTRTLPIEVGVPEFCIGTFNGFIGFVDSNRVDELALSNRGTFRLAAPSNANLSAKVVTAKGSYSFTAQGWWVEGDGVYTADLATADGKSRLAIRADEASTGLAASFREIGSFTPSYGTVYSVWAQRAPFARNSDGSYCDPVIDGVMDRDVGTWHFKAYASGSSWQLDYATAKTANLTLVVAADGTAKLAGKVGSYAVSASSAVFVFEGDVDTGFVRADFPVPVSVKSGKTTVKKTLDIWLNLWFDRDHSHYNARGEGIGAATLEAFE